jgi:hypothetical protein
MYSSISIKIFLILAALFCQSCGFWQSKSDATAPQPAPYVVEELKSQIPFSTKEPETFQTEIVLLAEGLEEKTFFARSGVNRLTIFDFQTESETSVLHLGAGSQSFIIARQRKIYAENEGANAGMQNATFEESLTAEWLNQKMDAKFERLEAENNLIKYRGILDESKNSETIIFVDEKIGLPVRQEFYFAQGEQRNLTATMELRNFNLQPDAKLFEVPADYRKLTAKEFRETLRRERTK